MVVGVAKILRRQTKKKQKKVHNGVYVRLSRMKEYMQTLCAMKNSSEKTLAKCGTLTLSIVDVSSRRKYWIMICNRSSRRMLRRRPANDLKLLLICSTVLDVSEPRMKRSLQRAKTQQEKKMKEAC